MDNTNQILGPNNESYKLSGGSLQSLSANSIDPYAQALGLPKPGDLTSSTLTAFRGGFASANPEVSIYRAARNNATGLGFDTEESYDPFKDLDPKYYAYSNMFEGVKSPGESLLVQSYLDDLEDEHKAAIERPITNFIGAATGTILSPINWATFGAGSAALNAAKIGSSVVRGAALGAATSVPLVTAKAAGGEPGYTSKDAISDVIINSVAGGAIDGTIAKMTGQSGLRSSGPERKTINREMMSKYEDLAETPGDNRLTSPMTLTPDDYVAYEQGIAIEGKGLTKPVFDFFTKGSGRNFQPSVSARLLTSPSPEVRKLTNDLVEHGFTLKGNEQGFSYNPSVESIMTTRQFQKDQYIDGIIDEGYVAHKKNGGNLKPSEFEVEVARAVRRGGSQDEVINKAALQYKSLMDEYVDRMKVSKVLGEDFALEDGSNYLTRMYDRDAIINDPEGWRNTLRGYVEEAVFKDYSDEIKAGKATINVETFDAEIVKRTDQALDEITSKILGARFYDGEEIVWSNASAKSRKLDIPDIVLEKYLRSDIRTIGKAYVSRTEKDIALHERFGTSEKEIILKKITDDYQARGVNGDLKLQSRMQEDLRDLEVVFDRLYGTRGLPKDPAAIGSQILKALPKYNMVRLLGGVILSQIPEAARSQILRATQWITSSFDDFAKQIEKINLSKRDLKALGAILEHQQQLHAISQGDVGMTNFLQKNGGIGKVFDAGVELFTKASGMQYMDNVTRGSLAVTGSRWMYSLSKKLALGKSLTKKELTWLAQYGIDEKMAKQIVNYTKKYGEKVDGVHYLNVADWDGKVGDTMRSAVRKYVNQYLINPGAGDKFLMADVNQMARVLMQFKSWFQGAWSRQLLPSLQNFTGERFAMMATMIALGFLQNRLMRAVQPETYREPRDGQQELLEALNRSGALPFLFDIYSMASTTSGFGGTVRQQQNGLVDTVFGPSAGLLSRNLPAVARLSTGNGRPGDWRAVKELIPYNNLLYIREIANKVANRADQRLRVQQKLGE